MFQRRLFLIQMLLPMLAMGQTTLLSPVCADPSRKQSCLSAQEVTCPPPAYQHKVFDLNLLIP